MTFAYSIMLAGAAAVAVPVVLHLLMRRRPRQMEFPALRFVTSRHQANQRQLRLRHLLLLLLRMAFIALLALALARPSIQWGGAWTSQDAPAAVAVIVDTSCRMDYRHEDRGGKTTLELAKGLALELLDQLPAESQAAVVDCWPGEAVFQVDLGAARDRVRRLKSLCNPQPLPLAIDEALRRLDQSPLARKEVYVLTDLAQVAWPGQYGGQLRQRLAAWSGTGTKIHVVDVGAEKPRNLAISDLGLSDTVLSSRSPLKIKATVASLGIAGRRNVALYLLEGGGAAQSPTAQKRDEKIVELAAGRSAQAELGLEVLGVGTHQGYVQIVGEDALACDDKRYFTVEVRPAWRVLLVAPEPPRRYARFLEAALAPPEFRKRGQGLFDCTLLRQDALAGHPLERYAAVCLVDPTPLEPAVWQKLADYVSAGRGLAVFLGPNATPVDSFNQPPADRLLAGQLTLQGRAPEGLALGPEGFEHPALALFRRRADVPWFEFPVYRYWQLKLAEKTNVLVPLSNGAPALVERGVNKGYVLTMITPVSYDPNLPRGAGAESGPWNLLPVGNAWPFGMLVNGMVSHLVGRGGQQLNYWIGQPAEIRLADGDGAADRPKRESYVLTLPDGQRAELAPDLTQQVVKTTATDQPGNYRLAAGGAAGIDRGFSVNILPDQTRLDRLSEGELAGLFGDCPYEVTRELPPLAAGAGDGRVARDLFAPLILLAALVLALEHVLANRFYRQ